MPDLTIGIDVGGTFTDVVGIAADGRQTLAKAASTPADQSEGVVMRTLGAEPPHWQLAKAPIERRRSARTAASLEHDAAAGLVAEAHVARGRVHRERCRQARGRTELGVAPEPSRVG